MILFHEGKRLDTLGRWEGGRLTRALEAEHYAELAAKVDAFVADHHMLRVLAYDPWRNAVMPGILRKYGQGPLERTRAGFMTHVDFAVEGPGWCYLAARPPRPLIDHIPQVFAFECDAHAPAGLGAYADWCDEHGWYERAAQLRAGQ